MDPNILPNLCFMLKLFNRRSNRYFIIDGLEFSGKEVVGVALLDLASRTRVWRPAEEINNLLLTDALEQWIPVEAKNF